MPPGTLLYRTGSNGQMFGYQGPLIETAGGIIKAVNAGHVAIYIGKIAGEDYIVEAIAGGIVKTPAKYFLNRQANEAYLGAKIPLGLSPVRQAKAVAIAKSLAERDLAYDFDFHRQKGSRSGDWTCVGLTEKIYESADISNPNNIAALEYDSRYYAIDITPDGYDNYSLANQDGDRFSRDKEFSQIARRTELLFPFPEKIGYSAGLEKDGARYLFMPYTQFLQPTLTTVQSDITLSTNEDYGLVRGETNWLAIGLRWSLINNPISSLKNIALKAGETAVTIKNYLLGSESGTAIVLDNKQKTDLESDTKSLPKAVVVKNTLPVAVATASSTSKTTSASNKTATSSNSGVKVNVQTTKNTNDALEGNNSPLVSKLPTTPALVKIYDPSVAVVAEPDSEPDSELNFEPEIIKKATADINSNPNAKIAEDAPKLANIFAVYATGANDWIELYNPTDYDFDLAAAGYRLEKTKSAADPGIMMRIGNTQDGTYPGGTIIKARGKYLIVRSEAADYFKNQAQAIATRPDFTWSGSGYTIYLGVGAISSNTDDDIVEALGFGPDSSYYQGSAPAPELTDNYVLSRVAYDNNNSLDYSLIKSTDPSISWTANDPAPVEPENDEPEESEDPDPTPDPDPTLEPDPVVPIISRIIINRIYATGNNEWLELYNPNPVAVDLAASGYRIEKTITADDPSLIMRIGNELDGTYPGGVMIEPGGVYKIVRAGASAYHINGADAIATRLEFLWSGGDYTLYLGKGPISSSQDEDIVDVVGYGPAAMYFLGSGPAPSITDGFILSRLADTLDNSSDFELVDSLDPDLVVAPDPDNPVTTDPGRYVFPEPIVSSGLVNVWHFDDCFGSGKRVVGKWDCALDLGATGSFASMLAPPADLDQFTISFYYKQNGEYARLQLDLANEALERFSVILTRNLATLEGFPNSSWRYYKEVPFDELWHQATVVVDQSQDYWAVYIDGEEIIREVFMANLPVLSTIDIKGDLTSAVVDEIAVWHRSLAPEEVRTNYLAGAPYYPITQRSFQAAPELLHFWQFAEDTGTSTIDEVASLSMTLDSSQWSARVHDNYAIATSMGLPISAALNIPLETKDFSVAFWWRNSSFPNEGRADIMFYDNSPDKKTLFGLEANYYRLGYYYNQEYGIFTKELDLGLPYDDNWHHVAMVYDSYRYRLSLYVDGVEVMFKPYIWLPDWSTIGSLDISTKYYQALLDDFRIYKGALNISDIQEIYTNTRAN